MNRMGRLILLLGLGLSVSAGRGETPDTPAEQYKALLDQYQRAGSGGSISDEERMKLVARVYQLRYRLALRFLELAEKHPTDPIAFDALTQAVWQVNNIPWPAELVGKDRAAARTLTLLQRDHIRSEKLGTVCLRVATGFAREYETFLRTVLAKSPHRHVRGLACHGLAQFLSNRLQRLNLVREQPALAREFEGLFGKEYLTTLLRQDRPQAEREAEALFERAVKQYADVEMPGDGTVGERARAGLFEIRHLVVGKVAPDIEGRDQDGKPFKLSDYRGKVVLLDFWHQQ